MIEENHWPIEVLVEIFKWFSIEGRLQQLAPVCKLFHQAVYTPKFWKTVDTNSEFTLSSFHSVLGHAKHTTPRFSLFSMTIRVQKSDRK